MTISNVQNVSIYSLKPALSQKLGSDLGAQTTGKTPTNKDPVKHAVGMQSEFYAQKVEGVLQNVEIARNFLLTAQANLGTVIGSLNDLAGEVMTLLNEALPAGNTVATAHKIVQTMGMVDGPISRDQQEGILIKTLRQGGTNQALYFHVTTDDFLSTDPGAITPPRFEMTGTPPNQTLDPSTFAQGTEFTGDLTIPPVATAAVVSFDGAAGAKYNVTLQCGPSTYTANNVSPQDNNPLVLNNSAGSAGDTITIKFTAGTVLKCYSSQADAETAAEKFRQALEACSTGTWIPAQMDTSKTKGFAKFVLDAGSNYGAGSFFFKYDGMNVWFHDAYKDLIEAYPLPFQILRDAGALAKETGELVEVPIGNIGTLFVDQHADGSAPAESFTFQTKTIPYNAILIVSANGDSRTITMSDITKPLTLWGEEIIFDVDRLQTEGEYQQKIKGMIDHASRLIRDTYQNVTNMVGVLEQDASSQHASLQSLKDLKSVVTDANVMEVATHVFDGTQQYIQLLNGVKAVSHVKSNEKNDANAIAELAGENF